MAPSVNLSDDVAELSRLCGQLFRLGMAGKLDWQRLTRAAAAAGLSPGQATQFAQGLLVLPPRQTVAYCNAVLDEARVAQAGYLTQIRQPHAGGNLMSDGQPLTAEAVAASVKRLEADFPGWAVKVDGMKTLSTGKPKLIWRAELDGDRLQTGTDAGELREKIGHVEAALAADDKIQKQYRAGGVRR